MGNIKNQIKSEMRRLPFLIGKLIGGIMTAIGIPGAIIIITRKQNPLFSDILPYLLLAISGIAVFLISSGRLVKREKEITEISTPEDRRRMSIISWLVFSVLTVLFLLIVYITTR